MSNRTTNVVSNYQNDYATQFDGVSSYATTPNTDLPTTAISVSAWVRVNQTIESASAWRFISDESANYGFDLGKGGTALSFSLRFRFSSSGITTIHTIGTNITQGVWYHMLLTFDGTNMRAYIDGVIKGTVNRAGQTIVYGASPSQSPFIRIGRTASTIYNAIDVDEISIWDRAVDVSEVASSNKPIDLTGASGLVRWYRMGDFYQSGSSQIVEKVSGTYPITLFNISESTDFVSPP